MRTSFLTALALCLGVVSSALALQPVGSRCTLGSECSTNICTELTDYYGDEGFATCRPGPAGHACTKDAECTTRACVKGTCARAADGDTCFFDSDCGGTSLRCVRISDYGDKNGFCADSIGARCSREADCGSKGCDRGYCGKPGVGDNCVSSGCGEPSAGGNCVSDDQCLGTGTICSIPSDACTNQEVNCVAVGTCTGKAPNGSVCRLDAACQSGRCSAASSKTGLGKCVDPATVGPKARPREPCYNDNDCLFQNGYPTCVYPNSDTTKTGSCFPQAVLGQCVKNSDCIANNCNTEKGKCQLNGGGESCSQNNDCDQLHFCNSKKVCDPNVDCSDDNQCTSSFTCVRAPGARSGICHRRTSVHRKTGAACKHDYECDSYKCSKNKCAAS